MTARPLRLADNAVQTFPGGLGFQGVTAIKTADYVVGVDDVFVQMSTAAARAVTLPAPTTPRAVWVKDATGTGGATNNITVSSLNGELIDGAATNVINEDRGVRMFYTNQAGTAWNVGVTT